MAYSQIRVNKTAEMQNVLNSIREHYELLSESDIVKMALSKMYFEFKQAQDSISAEKFTVEESEKIESLENYQAFLSSVKWK